MLVDCICGESKFAVNAEPIGFDGRLVRCGKCGKEWFQGSKQEAIEKKLFNIDIGMHAKEIKLADENNYYSDQISALEKELKSKNKEIEDQKILEKRITLFESRIKDSQAEILRQKKYEERINVLKKELEKKTLDLFIKNTALEKRGVELQTQMGEQNLSDRLSSLEKVLIKKKVGGKVINTQKPMEVFDVDDEKTEMQSVEINEITKVEKEEDKKANEEKLQEQESKKKEFFEETHHDLDDTSRIGRSGDFLKRNKN